MRTRNQSKRKTEENPTNTGDSIPHSNPAPKAQHEDGSPAKISKVAVGKLLDGANTRRRRKECRPDECDAKNEKVPRENDKLNEEHIHDFSLKRCNSGNGEKNTSNREWSAHCDANDTQNMQARNQPKHKKEENLTCDFGPNSNSAPKTQHENGSLVEISKEAVRMLLDRSNSRKRRKECRLDEDAAKNKKLPRENDELNKKHVKDLSLKGCNIGNAERGTSKGERSVHCDSDEMDWEEGNISVPEFSEGCSHDGGKDVTVEFMDSPSSDKKKRPRRASAEDKELAELVHKVHLLCLLARGRLVDNACNDPLIQAAILSLLPSCLLKTMEIPRLKAHMLGPLVCWEHSIKSRPILSNLSHLISDFEFHENFHVRSQGIDKGSFHSNLAYALESREGSPEEIAALSVALLRALNLRTRFVSVLDAASPKPETDATGTLINDAPRLDTKICTTSSFNPSDSFDNVEDQCALESQSGRILKKESSTCKRNLIKDVTSTNQNKDGISHAIGTKSRTENFDSCPTKSALASKRKGDLEFELQMEMALSATAATTHELREAQSNLSSPAMALKILKKANPSISNNRNPSAVWSRRFGPPLYWAEVYCSLETLNGRWVHVDAVNGVVDGEERVESAAAAWRRPLKYVVAFAGNGAKDVTRRYCMQWYKIAPRRINSDWWDAVLAPLKKLESGASSGTVDMGTIQEIVSSHDKKGSEVNRPLSNIPSKSSCSQECPNNESSVGGPSIAFTSGPSGISLEDAELETRALTEPLPTSQLAYKNHHLYAIERWLTKQQILHPRGPILGYCSGHPVYPRSCVQMVRTKHKWLREGFQVKASEAPAKVVKCSKKGGNVQTSEPNISADDDGDTAIELYGKWQLEPLQLPHAVNGIVPKNEWGQVDAWSAKCLPPGTVHLRLPRLVPVARRLDIDFAPAMVGFEFRNGRSVPVYEGIVVCTEFRDAIMEAYEEEEERRAVEERKKNEAQALSRWFQLLSSIVTRQRLQNSYVDASSSHNPPDFPVHQKNNALGAESSSLKHDKKSTSRTVKDVDSVFPSNSDHVHEFPIENQSFDENSVVRTKQCLCGFSIEVEEM